MHLVAGAKKLMLPLGAIQARAMPQMSPVQSPLARPVVTPNNVATSTWRTQICPGAPARRITQYPHLSSGEGSPMSVTSSAGLLTPMDCWSHQHAGGMLTPTLAQPAPQPSVSLAILEGAAIREQQQQQHQHHQEHPWKPTMSSSAPTTTTAMAMTLAHGDIKQMGQRQPLAASAARMGGA